MAAVRLVIHPPSSAPTSDGHVVQAPVDQSIPRLGETIRTDQFEGLVVEVVWTYTDDETRVEIRTAP